MQPTRRQFLGFAAAAGFGAAGCGGGDQGKGEFRGQKLRIFVYSGGHERTMRSVFVPAFEAATGATAVLDPGWWGSTAKLKMAPKGQPPYDLMVSDPTEGYPAIREGLFQQIDFKRIPNIANLSPVVLDNWVYKQGYGPTQIGSVMALAYHRESAPFTPTGWGDLLRPEVKEKVSLYNSFYMSLYTFACMKVASEGRPGTAAEAVDRDLDGVLKFAREHREQVRIWWPTTSDMLNNLIQKNCALGNMHSPEMLVALREHPELAAIVPEADRAFLQSMWLIPDGTPRRELAEVAMNLIYSEDVQLAFAREGGSPSSNPAVAAKMAAEDPLWKQIYPSTPAQLQAARYYPYDAYFRAWDHINEVWDREVLRKG